MVTCGTYVASVFIFCPHVCLRTKGRMIRLHCCHWDIIFLAKGRGFLWKAPPHMPPMLMNQEPISVQFYCSLGMLGWKMFDIWRMWPNIAFLSTLALEWLRFWLFLAEKKKGSQQTVQVHSAVHKMFVYFVTCSLLLSTTMMVIYFLLMLYMIIYESMNINKVLDYKGRALGAATFFVRFEKFPWIIFFFSCHHVKCICVLFFFPS